VKNNNKYNYSVDKHPKFSTSFPQQEIEKCLE